MPELLEETVGTLERLPRPLIALAKVKPTPALAENI
jgi:hypothetical protein